MIGTLLMARLKKNIIGIVDNGTNVEIVRLKRKGFFLVEDKKKDKRIWLILSKEHIKDSKQLKCYFTYLSGDKAITLDKELMAIIKKAWGDGIRNQEELMSEFVEKWGKDDEGNIIPVKFKENLVFNGVTVAPEHISEVVKSFDPKLLFSFVENEVTSRILLRTYGLDAKTFISVFVGVLLAIVVAYFIIKSNTIDVSMITNAVKNAVVTNASRIPQNATIIHG